MSIPERSESEGAGRGEVTTQAVGAASGRPGPATPVPGQTLAGRYTVLEQLGQGGMGVVLAAYDARLDRRVALKLLSERLHSSESAKARMLREAQAMARLNHPHVVHVYDAGTLEDGSLFIAMEMVEGQTLRGWCQEQPLRPWRQVLEAYLAAARGLAAAHAAGLVHRDFKPENVLVSREGRVRVTDFGVARAESRTPTPSTLPALALPVDAWDSQLTLPGMLVGTPKYMAPELLRGRPADARSDLFAFCVALYEALYGQPAFAGDTAAERLRLQRQGRVTPPPADSPVPAWVARAVLQGLAANPLERPASMGALIAALEDDPEAKRRALLRKVASVAAMAALAALAVAGWVGRQGLPAACRGLERRLAGTWDEAVKGRVRQALLGTGLPYAQSSYERVEAVLDGYTAQWVRQRTEACQAVGGQEAAAPQRLAVLQEYCLERRLSQVRALTGLIARGPDPELLPKVVQAARSLPPLEYCAEARALLAAVPPPEDPVVRRQVEALQAQVDQLAALEAAGKYKQGLQLGETLLEQAAKVAHAPLHAQALYQVARLRRAAGDFPGAEALLRQALPLAARGRDTMLLAQAWSVLVGLVGDSQARTAEALGLVLAMETAVEQADDDLARAESLHSLAGMHWNRGEYAQSKGYYERALALREKALGPEHPSVANTLISLAAALGETKQYEQAQQRLERALAIQQKALGLDHPSLAFSLSNLGLILQRLDRHEEARARHQRALTLFEQALGPDHLYTGMVLNNLGDSYLLGGQYEEARARYERALAIQQRALGAEHPNVATALHNLGNVYLRLGQYEQARAYYERALALREKVLGPEHHQVADSHLALGRTLVHLRRRGEAERHLQLAHSHQEQRPERGPAAGDTAR